MVVRRPAKNSNLDPAATSTSPIRRCPGLPSATKAPQQSTPRSGVDPCITDGTLDSSGDTRRYTAMADPADARRSSRRPRLAVHVRHDGAIGSPNVPTPPEARSRQSRESTTSSSGDQRPTQRCSRTEAASARPSIAPGSPSSRRPATPPLQVQRRRRCERRAAVTSGCPGKFHVAFTDNRDVIPPLSG